MLGVVGLDADPTGTIGLGGVEVLVESELTTVWPTEASGRWASRWASAWRLHHRCRRYHRRYRFLSTAGVHLDVCVVDDDLTGGGP